MLSPDRRLLEGKPESSGSIMALIAELIQNFARIGLVRVLRTAVIRIGVGDQEFIFSKKKEMLGHHHSGSGDTLGGKS